MHIGKKRFNDRNLCCLIISRSMKISRELTLNISLTVKTSNENSMYTYEKSYLGILSLHALPKSSATCHSVMGKQQMS